MFSWKKTFAFLFFALASCFVFAQQHITNFGVIDTNKVYEAFFRNSSAVRSYEKKRDEVQAELDKRANEIRELQARAQEAQELGLESDVKRYENLIRQKTTSLKNYTQTKQNELDNMRKSLSGSNEFYKDLNRTIKKVAENEGLSMVINVQQNNSILWYSPAVDITDKVISAMK